MQAHLTWQRPDDRQEHDTSQFSNISWSHAANTEDLTPLQYTRQIQIQETSWLLNKF